MKKRARALRFVRCDASSLAPEQSAVCRWCRCSICTDSSTRQPPSQLCLPRVFTTAGFHAASTSESHNLSCRRGKLLPRQCCRYGLTMTVAAVEQCKDKDKSICASNLLYLEQRNRHRGIGEPCSSKATQSDGTTAPSKLQINCDTGGTGRGGEICLGAGREGRGEDWKAK